MEGVSLYGNIGDIIKLINWEGAEEDFTSLTLTENDS
jgi:hypothetical protein